MKRRNLRKAVVGKTIVDVYLDLVYVAFKLSDGSTFQVHVDNLFDQDGNRFNMDNVDYRY